jgi:hypothetical protein
MKIREIFSGNISTLGMIIQHQCQLIMTVFLLLADWAWELNDH